jgi:hypothetical protein
LADLAKDALWCIGSQLSKKIFLIDHACPTYRTGSLY